MTKQEIDERIEAVKKLDRNRVCNLCQQRRGAHTTNGRCPKVSPVGELQPGFTEAIFVPMKAGREGWRRETNHP